MDNAIKYSPLGGEVLISTVKDSAKLSITVQDHVKNACPLDQPKLFTALFPILRKQIILRTWTGSGSGDCEDRC